MKEYFAFLKLSLGETNHLLDTFDKRVLDDHDPNCSTCNILISKLRIIQTGLTVMERKK